MKFPSYTFFTEKVKYADSFGPFIRINPKYKYQPDLAIYEHEHVKQWYQITFTVILSYIILCLSISVFLPSLITNFLLHGSVLLLCSVIERFLYKHFTAYRQYTEVRAYAKQIDFLCIDNKYKLREMPMYIDHFSSVLCNGYNLKLSHRTAVDLISKELR
jgi:hypothetical protein